MMCQVVVWYKFKCQIKGFFNNSPSILLIKLSMYILFYLQTFLISLSKFSCSWAIFLLRSSNLFSICFNSSSSLFCDMYSNPGHNYIICTTWWWTNDWTCVCSIARRSSVTTTQYKIHNYHTYLVASNGYVVCIYNVRM